MSRTIKHMSRTIINLPKSNRVVDTFKRLFTDCSYYGASSLGSGRKSYLLPSDVVKARIGELKSLGITVPKHQPFI